MFSLRNKRNFCHPSYLELCTGMRSVGSGITVALFGEDWGIKNHFCSHLVHKSTPWSPKALKILRQFCLYFHFLFGPLLGHSHHSVVA